MNSRRKANLLQPHRFLISISIKKYRLHLKNKQIFGKFEYQKSCWLSMIENSPLIFIPLLIKLPMLYKHSRKATENSNHEKFMLAMGSASSDQQLVHCRVWSFGSNKKFLLVWVWA